MPMAAALIIGVLVLIIAVLAVKIILLRSAADAIAQQFDDRLRADTNTPITLSCRDAHMRQLASAINDALANCAASACATKTATAP